MEPSQKWDVDWHWPETSQEVPEEEITGIRSPYEMEPPAFCYPGTRLEDDVGRFAAKLLPKQLNIIGTHTHGEFKECGPRDTFARGEDGFEQAQALERRTLWMVMSMIGGSPNETDGYFCGGGTEANLEGLWIGRERLCEGLDPFAALAEPISVLITSLTHYSVPKAAHMLRLGKFKESPECEICHHRHVRQSNPNGSGPHLVPLTEKGEMSEFGVLEMLKTLYGKGMRRFLVVPTIGTTVLGSVDRVDKICAVITKFQVDHGDARIYVHVDASFAGFTVPFVAPEEQLWFQNPLVQSITLDADKMGHLPYPAGIFFCRKDLQKHIARYVEYVGGNNDDTVSGSRSAIAPLFAFWRYQRLGKRGQVEFVRKCLAARDKLVSLLKTSFERDDRVNLFPCSPWTNFLPIEIRIRDGAIPEEVLSGALRPYALHSDFVPSDWGNPQSCPRIVYKLCIMPHTFQYLERFVEDIRKVLNG